MTVLHKSDGTGGIIPGGIYTLGAFQRATGIGDSIRRLAARNYGIELKLMRIGRRKFVRGEDGLAFLESMNGISVTSK